MALGVLGAYLPFMPSFPFLLLASMCFVKSSKRLEHWFKTTKIYKEVLAPYFNKQGLTRRVRIQLSLSCAVFFGISIYFSRNIPHLQFFLIFLGVAHVVYFLLIAKKREQVESKNSPKLEERLK